MVLCRYVCVGRSIAGGFDWSYKTAKKRSASRRLTFASGRSTWNVSESLDLQCQYQDENKLGGIQIVSGMSNFSSELIVPEF